MRTWQINQTFSGWTDIFKALWWALLTAHREQRRTAAQKGLVVGMSSCQQRAGSYATHSEGSLPCPTHLVHNVFSCKEDPPSLPFFSSLLWLVDLKIQRHILLAFFETLPSTGFSRGGLRRQKHYCHKKRSLQLLSEKADVSKFTPPEEAIKHTQWTTSPNTGRNIRCTALLPSQELTLQPGTFIYVGTFLLEAWPVFEPWEVFCGELWSFVSRATERFLW